MSPVNFGMFFNELSVQSGILSESVLPLPISLSTETSPSNALTRCLTIARPSPVPPISPVLARSARKNRQKIRDWFSREMPTPVSRTEMTACVAS
jgi:hypothetical protein